MANRRKTDPGDALPNMAGLASIDVTTLLLHLSIKVDSTCSRREQRTLSHSNYITYGTPNVVYKANTESIYEDINYERVDSEYTY